MKHLADEIVKGKNLEINLSSYGQEMMAAYNKYAAVRLAMNYYTFKEMLSDDYSHTDNEDNNHKSVPALAGCIDQILYENILKPSVGSQLEKAVASIDSIRNTIIDIMKGLTGLVDIFNIYEYVLNRIEYRFKDSSHVQVMDDEKFSKQLLAYLVSGDDNVVVNQKISEAVRQLPVRMTKNRFFELLKEGLMVYKDSQKSSVDDFIYILSTSTMLENSESTREISDDINEIISMFEKTDFSNITEDEYDKLKKSLDYSIDFIQNSVNKYMMLAEIVNDSYTILLSAPYAQSDSVENNVLNTVIESFAQNNLTITSKAEESLVLLEGRQEKLYASISSSSFAISEAINNYGNEIESLMLKGIYAGLERIEKLESGSIFIEFDRVCDTDIAGEDYVLNVYENIKEKYSSFFKNNNKLVNRAVMAHVLGSLPVFFNNTDEIKGYIYNSLSGCSDKAEKTACMEIFASMMEEDGFNVV